MMIIMSMDDANVEVHYEKSEEVKWNKYKKNYESLKEKKTFTFKSFI